MDERPVGQYHDAEAAHGQPERRVLHDAAQAMRSVPQDVVGHLLVGVVQLPG